MALVSTTAVAGDSWIPIVGFSLRWLLALAFAVAAWHIGRRLLEALAKDEPIGFDRSWGGLGGSEGGWRATRALVYLVLLLASLGGLVMSVPAHQPRERPETDEKGDAESEKSGTAADEDKAGEGDDRAAEDPGEQTTAAPAESPATRPTATPKPSPTASPTSSPAATAAGSPSAR